MKKIYLLGLLPLLIILMAYGVNGAIICTFDQTATTAGTSSTYIWGSDKNLSVTMSGWTSDANSSTAIISAGATGCDISGTLTFNTSTNTNQSYMNTTVNTLAMKDDTTCTFTMTIKNASNQAQLTTCTRDYISDNTKPVLSSTSPAEMAKDTDGKVSFSYTCSNSSSAILYLDLGGYKPYTMTESSDVCSYSSDRLSNGILSWYITASDGLNTTTSSTNKVEIRLPGGMVTQPTARKLSELKGAESVAATTAPSGNRNTIIIASLLLIGYFISKVKSKR